MIFKEALAAMQEGKKVKCPEWLGFWQMKNGKIMMHCKDGNVINLTDTEDIIYTLSFVTRDDWMILDEDYTYEPIIGMRFEEALRNLRLGKKVARRGWNGKDQFVYYTTTSYVQLDELKSETRNHVHNYYKINRGTDSVTIKGHLDLKNAQDEIIIGWAPSQSDLMAEDWYIVE